MRIVLQALEERLQTQTIGRVPGWPNELARVIESTSTRAAELAAAGAPEGVLVLARRQTAGRGRLSKSWHSPPDSGIYMSVILRPQLPPNEIPLLSLVAGIACTDAIAETCGIKVGLKWVNDLIHGGKKVGGILAELCSAQSCVIPGTDAGFIQAAPVILGIGVNVCLNESEVPEELKQKIDWLERIKGDYIDANELAASICMMLESHYNDLKRGMHELVISRWKERSVTLGKEICATVSGNPVVGKAIDIAGNGGLILQTSSGEMLTLTGGEISIRCPDGTYA